MREVERRVVLSVLDRKWREHLYEMDYLREGVSLRGYGQRDPLIEYQREGYDMFTTMMEGIKEESVINMFNLQVQVQDDPIVDEDGVRAAPARPGDQPARARSPPPSRRRPRRPPQRSDRSRSAAAAAGTAAAGSSSRAGSRRTDEAGLPAGLARGLARPQRTGASATALRAEDASGTAEHTTGSASSTSYANVGRNAPCPCGSGRKFKQCHGDPRNR